MSQYVLIEQRSVDSRVIAVGRSAPALQQLAQADADERGYGKLGTWHAIAERPRDGRLSSGLTAVAEGQDIGAYYGIVEPAR